MRHMTKDQIAALDERALSAIIRTTSRWGKFAQELVWAKQEADRRARQRYNDRCVANYVAEGLGEW